MPYNQGRMTAGRSKRRWGIAKKVPPKSTVSVTAWKDSKKGIGFPVPFQSENQKSNSQMANLEQKVNQLSVLQKIDQAQPMQIVNIPEVGNRFKQLYKTIHRSDQADAFFEAEKFHFNKLLNENQRLSSCTKLSLFGCFLDVAVSGLSFDPSFKHLYMVPYGNKAQVQISGPGELRLRMMQGQIKHVDNPVLVYEGDEFSFGTVNGQFVVNHMANLAKRTNKILAGYLKITRNDGSVDYKVMTAEELEQLRKFSKDPNSKAWTDGYKGMFETKLIKHAFKNYPKIRIGENTQLASETIDVVVEEQDLSAMGNATMQVPDKIDYGVGGETFGEPEPPKAPAATVQHDDEAF
jgi:phage RecT family recombinase